MKAKGFVEQFNASLPALKRAFIGFNYPEETISEIIAPIRPREQKIKVEIPGHPEISALYSNYHLVDEQKLSGFHFRFSSKIIPHSSGWRIGHASTLDETYSIIANDRSEEIHIHECLLWSADDPDFFRTPDNWKVLAMNDEAYFDVMIEINVCQIKGKRLGHFEDDDVEKITKLSGISETHVNYYLSFLPEQKLSDFI